MIQVRGAGGRLKIQYLISGAVVKSFRVQELAEKLYSELRAQGIEVLLDDRKERPGVMFADMELIGIPHRIVISDRGLKESVLEYKHRAQSDSQNIAVDDILRFMQQQITL